MSMFRLLRLEERIVLDGAAMLDILDEMNANDIHDQEMQDAAAVQDAPDGDGGDFDSHEPLYADALDGGDLAIDDGLNVLVISSDVEDADDLAAAAKDNVLVVRYDAANTDLDALAGLISEALDGQKADSIAFANHNGTGGAQVQLTDTVTTSLDALADDAEQQAFWQSVGAQLEEGGRIDLLACDVVADESGEAFLASLEDIAGANVAASTDATGNDAYGGDWVLESDGVDVQSAYFDAEKLESFEGVLHQGEDPDPGYDLLYDVQVTAGAYDFVPVSTSTWTDVDATGGATGQSVSLSFTGVESWLYWVPRSQGFLSFLPSAGSTATISVSASDADGNTNVDTFTVTAVDATELANQAVFADPTVTAFAEGAANTTTVATVAATDPDGGTVSYSIVSGNPTENGTNFAFEIDSTTGEITILDTTLLTYDDPYETDHVFDLVVRAEDDEGIYSFTTVEVPITEGEIQHEVTLTVKDSPGADSIVIEEGTTAQVTVGVDRGDRLDDTVVINLTLTPDVTSPADSSDYSISPIPVTLGPGNTSVAVTIAVTDDDDTVNEKFTIDIDRDALAAATSGPTLVDEVTTPIEVTLTPEKPVLTLNLGDTTFSEGGQTTLQATLTGAVSERTEVSLTFEGVAGHGTPDQVAVPPDGTIDFTSTETVLVFEAGATLSNELVLDGVVDNLTEGDEEFSVSVIADAADPFKVTETSGSQVGTITDAIVEIPTVRLVPVVSSFNEGETIDLQAYLVKADGTAFIAGAGGITVNLSVVADNPGGATPDVDFSASSTLFIPEGESTAVSGTIYAKPDSETEGDEFIRLSIEPSNDYQVGFTAQTLTIKDVVTPVVTIEGDGETGLTEADPGDAQDFEILTIERSQASTSAVDVVVSATAGSNAVEGDDYTFTYEDGSTVSKNVDGDWVVQIPANETSASVKVTAVNDDLYEGSTAEVLGLEITPSGSDVAGSLNVVTLNITDDDAADVPTVGVYIDASAPYAGDTGTFTEGGTALEAAVALEPGQTPPGTSDVVVYLSPSADGAGDNNAEAEVDYIIRDSDGNIVSLETAGDHAGTYALTIENGFNAEKFTISAIGGTEADNFIEGVEDFNLTIAGVDFATADTANNVVTGFINDGADDLAAINVSLDLTPTSIHEFDGVSQADLDVTLTLDGGYTFSDNPVTVSLDDTGGTATVGEDYNITLSGDVTGDAAGPWSLEFNPTAGATEAGTTFQVSGVRDENAAEGNETFTLTATVGTESGSVTGTIIDDPSPLGDMVVTLDEFSSVTTIDEDGGTLNVDLSLSREYFGDDLEVTLQLGGEATPDTDYVIRDADGNVITVGGDSTFTLAIDREVTSASFTVEAQSDAVFENGGEDFTVQLAGVTAAPGVVTDFSTNVETGVISESGDMPMVSLFFRDAGSNVSDISFTEAAPQVKVLVAELDTPTDSPVIINLSENPNGTDTATSTDGDYSVAGSQITIDAGDTQGFLNLNVGDDLRFEQTENFQIGIESVQGDAANIGTDNIVNGTIFDDDADEPIQVSLEWTDSENPLVVSEGVTSELTVEMDRTSADATLVTLDFSNDSATYTEPADYVVKDGTTAITIDGSGQYVLTLDPGETQAKFNVEALSDTVLGEPDETLSVAISDVDGGTNDFNKPAIAATATSVVTATIQDDDSNLRLQLVVDDTSVTEGDSIFNSTTIRVQAVDAVAGTPVAVGEEVTATLDFGALADGAVRGDDFNVTFDTLTLSPGDTEATVVLKTIPDTVFEPDEAFTVGIAEASAATLAGADSENVTIVNDDDTPTVTLELNATNSDALNLVEAAGSVMNTTTDFSTITLDLGLDSPSYTDTVVTLAFSGATDFEGADADVVVQHGAALTDFTQGTSLTITLPANSTDTYQIVLTGVSEGLTDGDKNLDVEVFSVTGGADKGDATSSAVNLVVKDDDLKLYADLNYESAVVAGSTEPVLDEDPMFVVPVSPGILTMLDVNLVDVDGNSMTVPIADGATVTVKLTGTATVDTDKDGDGDVDRDDYGIYRDLGGITVSDPVGFDILQANNDGVYLFTEGGDTFLVVEFGQGESTKTVYLAGVEDNVYEQTEDISFEIRTDMSLSENIISGTEDNMLTVEVIDNDDPPKVALTAVGSVEMTEGATPAEAVTFQVAFEGATASEVETGVTVRFSKDMFDADAQATTDYIVKDAAGNTLDLVSSGDYWTTVVTLGGADGLDSTTFTVEAVDNNLFEVDENFQVSVTADTTDPYTVSNTDFEETVTIYDDDTGNLPLVRLTGGGDFSEDAPGATSATIRVDLVDDAGNALSMGSDAKVTLSFGGEAQLTEGTSPADDGNDDYVVNVDGSAVTFASGSTTLVVEVPTGETSVTINLDAYDDTFYEVDEGYEVSISSAGVGDIAMDVFTDEGTVTGTLFDNDTAPEVTLAWVDADGDPVNTVSEPERDSVNNEAFLQVTLSEASGVDTVVTVGFGGTADYTFGTSGPVEGDDVSDFGSNQNVITIEAGQTQASFDKLKVLADDAFEGTEDLVVSITGADGATIPTTGDVATLTILDDLDNDRPTVSLSISPTEIYEVTAPAGEVESTPITITLSTPIDNDTAEIDLVFNGVTVGLDTDAAVTADIELFDADGNAITISAGGSATVEIPAGATEYTVYLQGADDALRERDEGITVAVSDATVDLDGTEFTLDFDANALSTVTIHDSEDNPEVVLTTTDTVFTEGPTPTNDNTATFTVELQGGTSFFEEVITIDLNGTADPGAAGDYTVDVAGGTAGAIDADGKFDITLAAGATSATVTLTAVDDAFYETPELVEATVDSVSAGLSISADADTVSYMLNDTDEAPQVVLEITPAEFDEEGGATIVTAKLVNSAGTEITAQTPITVNLDVSTLTSGGNAVINEDYRALGDLTLTITTGAGSDSVILEGIGDGAGTGVYEGNEIFTVGVASVVNAEVSADFDTVTGTIIDDDPGPKIQMTWDTTVIDEANGEVAVTLKLVDENGNPVTSPVSEDIYLKFTDLLGTEDPGAMSGEANYADELLAGVYSSGHDYALTNTTGVVEFPTMSGFTQPAGDLSMPETIPGTSEQGLKVTIPSGSTSVTYYLHAIDDGNVAAPPPGGQWLYEGDENFTITIDADSSFNDLEVYGDNAVTVTIKDDDSGPTVSLDSFAGTGEYTEGGVGDNIKIVMDSTLPAQSVEVTLSYADSAADIDITNVVGNGSIVATDPGAGTVTVALDPGETTLRLSFDVVDDSIFEGDEELKFEITDVDLGTFDSSANTLTATIHDNDTLKIGISVNTGGEIDDDSTATVGDFLLSTGGVEELEVGQDLSGEFFVITKDAETFDTVYVRWELATTGDDATAGEDFDFGGTFTGATQGVIELARDAGAVGLIPMTIFGDNIDEQAFENVSIQLTAATVGSGTDAIALDVPTTFASDTATVAITDDDFRPTEVNLSESTSGAPELFTVDEGGTGEITLDNLQYYDEDDFETGDLELTYTVQTAPEHGDLYLGEGTSDPITVGETFTQGDIDSGKVWYQNDGSEFTSDSFDFTVTDLTNVTPSAGSETFYINVNSLNDAPEAESVVFWVNENTVDGALSDTPDMTGADVIATDGDGDALLANATTGIIAGNESGFFTLAEDTAGELKVELAPGVELDHEFQASHTLIVQVADGTADTQTLVVVVNVNDLATGDPTDPYAPSVDTITAPDVQSDTTWTYQIPEDVFPDAASVTYQAVVKDVTVQPEWLHFEQTATFWYSPVLGETIPSTDEVLEIEVTANYWDGNGVKAGFSKITLNLTFDNVLASLDTDEIVLDALDYLEEDGGEHVLPEDGAGMEIQDMMMAQFAPEDGASAAALAEADEFAEVLALLEGAESAADGKQTGEDSQAAV